MPKGPYFVYSSNISAFLGGDQRFYSVAELRQNYKLAKFAKLDSATKAVKAISENQKTAQVVTSNTARTKFKMQPDEWANYLCSVFTITNFSTNDLIKNSPSVPTVPVKKYNISNLESDPIYKDEAFNIPLILDTIDILERAAAISERWAAEAANCTNEISRLDRVICDELHFVEFMKLDIFRAYKSYRRLHQFRIERRQYKNIEQISNILMETLKTSHTELGFVVKSALRRIEGLKDRIYDARESWPVEDDHINFTTKDDEGTP